MQTPAEAEIGDKIEHELMPGFVMTVEDVRDCERDTNRYLPHKQYLITDPEGEQDWLCGFDVRKVG